MGEAGIALTPAEAECFEVADFGLGRLAEIGLEVLVYVNTERVCAKELVLFPGQTCPEHLHPPVAGQPGKEETFRCRRGEVWLYVPGPAAERPLARLPGDMSSQFTVWHEVCFARRSVHPVARDAPLVPGRSKGAIVSEFSTRSTDEADIFTDPEIRRVPEVL